MKKYNFKPKNYPVITKQLIQDILKMKDGEITTTLTLGKTYQILEKEKYKLKISKDLQLDLIYLNQELDENYVYAITSKGILRIAFYKNGLYYKLLPITPYTAPTIEISGIRMHRTEGITPWEDAKQKIEALGNIKGKIVLDICTGAGYTAIHSLLRGAKQIITIEKDKNVLEIVQYNPWSKELSSEKITIILEDATKYVNKVEAESIDVIIHDPPRLARAGELYSTKFYKELHRILRKHGKLYHYTGKPGYKKRHINLLKTVAKRLQQVGFKTKINPNLQGILAIKK